MAMCAVASGEGCATVPAGRPSPPRGDSLLAEFRMRTILEAHWNRIQERAPTIRIWSGGGVAELPDVSLAAAKTDASFARALLGGLDDVNVDALSEDMYVSWLALEWDLTMLQRVAAFYWTDLSAVVPSTSPLRTSLEALQQQPLSTTGDAQRYVYLVGQYAVLADSVRAGLAARAGRGSVLPRLLLRRTSRFVRSLLGPANAPALQVTAARLTGLDTLAVAQFRLQLDEAIVTRVTPALERLTAYLEGEYARQATDTIGLWHAVGGKEHYRFLVRYYSTIDITPEDAHTVGLREVARLDSLARITRQRTDLPGTRDSLQARLRFDPRYAVETPTDVTDRLLSEYSRAASVMGKAFSRSPEVDVDVGALPAAVEDLAPLAVYRGPSVPDPKAHYLFNTARWRDRSLLRAGGRVYADLLPGRHFQVALQRENGTLAAFRRVGGHAGFADGWSTYALALSDSLDAPQNDAARFGVLLEELSAACGLVVDTGINYFGWTRDQALEFLRGYLPESDGELEREFVIPAVEAPASLTAATLGARELQGFQRWARRELGPRFDLRAFHDELLSLGSLPLPVFGKHVEWWIWRERSKVVTDTAAALRLGW
jgi:prolyl oligopeptidase